MLDGAEGIRLQLRHIDPLEKIPLTSSSKEKNPAHSQKHLQIGKNCFKLKIVGDK